MATLRDTAPAKVNLSLRVLGRRADGYHELLSLVVFAGARDVLELAPGDELSLMVEGPFAAALGPDNLVLRAAERLLRERPEARAGAFRLDKRLPVAAGIGGGSADAAAALRLLARANPDIDGEAVAALGARLGADVPVCFLSRPALVSGIGETVWPLDTVPRVPAVLANPGPALPTSEVFAALRAPPLALGAARAGAGEVPRFADADALVAYLRAESNDLQAAATRLAPAIGDALSALEAAPGCRLARMSGSGPTCFGLFDGVETAAAAAADIARARPRWWVTATELEGSGEARLNRRD